MLIFGTKNHWLESRLCLFQIPVARCKSFSWHFLCFGFVIYIEEGAKILKIKTFWEGSPWCQCYKAAGSRKTDSVTRNIDFTCTHNYRWNEILFTCFPYSAKHKSPTTEAMSVFTAGLPAKLTVVRLRRHAGGKDLRRFLLPLALCPHVGVASQAVPAAMSQVLRWHIRTRLFKW